MKLTCSGYEKLFKANAINCGRNGNGSISVAVDALKRIASHSLCHLDSKMGKIDRPDRTWLEWFWHIHTHTARLNVKWVMHCCISFVQLNSKL